MKKFKLSALLIYALILGFSACGGGGGGSDDPGNPDNSVNDPLLEINGDTYTYTLPGGAEFNLILTPDIPTTNTFPTGIDDKGSANVPARFIIGETEVTYQLWKEVYDWATSVDRGSDKYTFYNVGHQGGELNNGNKPVGTNQHPVTIVSWRDSIVWCNALTEYYNANNGSATDLECVYAYSGSIIRDSRESNSTACDNVVQKSSAKGFRLPGKNEWEYAARYIGTSVPLHTNYILKDGIYYTKGNSASGATADCSNASATSKVAVYDAPSTAIVKTKGESGTNVLGLYDMSGNVSEWCFDKFNISYSYRTACCGCWPKFLAKNESLRIQQVGFINNPEPRATDVTLGFRFCRSR